MTEPSGARPEVVVLGDMRDIYHHGCDAVMGQLLAGLAESGLSVGTVLAGLDWAGQAELCLNAPLVVINGEGALHHDRPVVQTVLELAEKRRKAGLPTALVNSSWFANREADTRRLSAFDLVALRDPLSRAEASAAGIVSLDTPDLAIREALRQKQVLPDPAAPGAFMVSDSTKPELTKRLRSLAGRKGWTYLPVLRPPTEVRPGSKSRKIRRKLQWMRLLGPLAKHLVSPRYHAHLVGAPDLAAYGSGLLASRGVVTGRFHTACLCVGLGVPFVAIASNTPKIEALVRNAGLDPDLRLIPPEALATLDGVPPFTAAELAALTKFAADAEKGFAVLFERLGKLLPFSR